MYEFVELSFIKSQKQQTAICCFAIYLSKIIKPFFELFESYFAVIALFTLVRAILPSCSTLHGLVSSGIILSQYVACNTD